MNWIMVLGSAGLGVVIGVLIAWYLLDLGQTDFQALSSAVAIALGGAVLGFFKFLSGSSAPSTELWTYPIGLFLGFVGALSVDWYYRGYAPNRMNKSDR
jgi:hypothetical protein